MARPFWIAVGFLALTLGIIGIVLPVLPTTPFVILAAFAFGKGAPRLAAMLENHHVFGPILQDWKTHGAIATKYKVIAVGMMAASIVASFAFGIATSVLVIQITCMLGAAAFVLSRPSRRSRK